MLLLNGDRFINPNFLNILRANDWIGGKFILSNLVLIKHGDN